MQVQHKNTLQTWPAWTRSTNCWTVTFAIFVPAASTQNTLKPLPFEQHVITFHAHAFASSSFFSFSFEVNFADCIHSWTCTEWSTGRWTAELGITMVIVTQIIPNYIALVQAFNWKQKGEKGRQAMSTSQRCERENQSTVKKIKINVSMRFRPATAYTFSWQESLKCVHAWRRRKKLSLSCVNITPHQSVSCISITPHRSVSCVSITPHQAVPCVSITPHQSVSCVSISPNQSDFSSREGTKTSSAKLAPIPRPTMLKLTAHCPATFCLSHYAWSCLGFQLSFQFYCHQNSGGRGIKGRGVLFFKSLFLSVWCVLVTTANVQAFMTRFAGEG